MRRSARTSVQGVSRSGRKTSRYVIPSESPPTSEESSPEREVIAPPRRSKRETIARESRSNVLEEDVIIVDARPASNIANQPRKTGQDTRQHETRTAFDPTTQLPELIEDIEEYTFSSGDEPYDDELNGISDVQSHISLSSDDPPNNEHQYDIDLRPWRQMSVEQRFVYETMFVSITNPAVSQSWAYTEEYQAQIDEQLLRYMQDFPLPTWVIGIEGAERAYHQQRERSRWRQLGIRIYGAERLPGLYQPLPGQGLHNQPTPAHPTPERTLPEQGLSGQSLPDQSVHHVQTSLYNAPEHAPLPPRTQAMPLPPVKQEPVNPPQTHAHPPRPHTNIARQSTKQAQKKAKDGSSSSPTSRATTPPYPARDRPPVRQARPNYTGKKPARKPAEAEEFPWNRDIDFNTAKAKATWRMEIYDPATLKIMAQVREHNEPIIERLDQEVSEKQRQSRNARKKKAQSVDTPTEPLQIKGRRRKDRNERGTENDPYHSGYFAFATKDEEAKAKKLGFHMPDGLLTAGERNEITEEVLADIKLIWNPGRKGLTYDLVQAPFSARDTVLTRKQLADSLILTRQAADCIIDFCPDLLWRDVLLRICSEAGCGNKDVRDRFCLNGCHADKATFTKRISAALGQKQTQQKGKGYAPGEWEFYEGNGEDFKDYIEFFGNRLTTRNMKNGAKRKRASGGAAGDDADDDSDEEIEVSDKRAKLVIEDEDELGQDVVMRETGNAGDTVSIQDSDALDDMSD